MTQIVLTVPNGEVSFLSTLAEKMGWSFLRKMKVILDTNIWISFLLGKIGLQAIVNLFELINAKCRIINGYADAESAIRDIKDLYLLSMAENIPADYLVTGDQDLLVLKNHLGTKIITFAEFVLIVQGNQTH